MIVRTNLTTQALVAVCALCAVACQKSANNAPGTLGGGGGVGIGSFAGTGAAGFSAGTGLPTAGSSGVPVAGSSAGTGMLDAAVSSMPDAGAAGSGAGMGGMGGSDAAISGIDSGTCPPAPSTASPTAAMALDALNKIRSAAGAGCATHVQGAADSARKHCEYYAANKSNMMCISNAHVEVSGCMSFVAANFGDRMKAAGYAGQPAFEVMAFLQNPQGAVNTWVDSVWHRLPMLDPWHTDMGYGDATKCDTIDFGRGTPGPSSAQVVYPYKGQTGVPTSFNGQYEGPMPPTPSSGWPSGYPITAYAKQISITSHVLTKDGDSTPIAHIWLTSADSNFLMDDVMMYAEKPLSPATKYHVVLTGTSIGGPLNLDWTFTTK